MPFRAMSLILLVTMLLAGCATYTTPGGPADFSRLGLTPDAKAALTDRSVQRLLDKKPLVTFPASLAVARVQAVDYSNYSFAHNNYYRPYSTGGAYSVITVRDAEKDEDFDQITKLQDIAGVAGLKRILLTGPLQDDLQLREAAAKLHANLLLIYTFDTEFHVETRVRPLTLVSLGAFPNKDAHVTCTASALLMDTNNGYIYSVLESTATENQLANAWSSDEAIDDARKRAERQAFVGLINQFKSEWPHVVSTYDRPVHQASAGENTGSAGVFSTDSTVQRPRRFRDR